MTADHLHLHEFTHSFPTVRPSVLFRYGPVLPPSRLPRLASRSSRPIWSSAGQVASSLPKLPCSVAISMTNWALSRTERIFCGLRTMRLSAVSFRSEEHTDELQSLMRISYAVFCLTKTKHT